MAEGIDRLLEVMARLRDPEHGCPWDREQSFATIAPYTVEEAHEVAEAIVRGDMDGLREELGDLLFQVVFHAHMASEAGLFAFDEVVEAIVDKMVRRHPHVFAGESIGSAEAQSEAWEAHKRAERSARGSQAEGFLDGVPRGLPALARALRLGRAAARAGFDWARAEDVEPVLREELDELAAALRAGERERIESELGDLLFACVNLARHLGLDPEMALRGSNVRFEQRFRRMEAFARDRGGLEGLDSHTLERLWAAAKREERSGGG